MFHGKRQSYFFSNRLSICVYGKLKKDICEGEPKMSNEAFLVKDKIYCIVVFIVGFLAQFLWEAQAHKVSGRYIIDNVLAQFLWEAQAHKVSGRYIIGNC